MTPQEKEKQLAIVTAFTAFALWFACALTTVSLLLVFIYAVARIVKFAIQ